MGNKIVRQGKLCERLVVVDGLPGCGKTMLSSIISSFDRVELLKYSYEIENYCILNHFDKIDLNTSSSMIQHQLDLLIYNIMMGREVNFRFSDLSSVFKSNKKIEYFRRIFSAGDELVPEKISLRKPILHLVTHSLTAYSNPLLEIFNDEMLLINFHRNPLFMIKQNVWNMENLLNSNRHFTLYLEEDSRFYPYYFIDKKEAIDKLNPIEKAIYFLEFQRKNYLNSDVNKSKDKLYEIRFESFVKDPYPYINKISKKLKTKITKKTESVLKQEKIPRKLLTHGRDLPIYKRVNWEKSSQSNQHDEKKEIYDWVCSKINKDAKKSLEWLLDDYTEIEKRVL